MRGEYKALGREGKNSRGYYCWKEKKKEHADLLFNKHWQSRKPGSSPLLMLKEEKYKEQQ